MVKEVFSHGRLEADPEGAETPWGREGIYPVQKRSPGNRFADGCFEGEPDSLSSGPSSPWLWGARVMRNGPEKETGSWEEMVSETGNPLDEEVAIRILGYRWVVWKSLDQFPLPREEVGRFLVPPDHPLAREMVEADPGVPLAKEPDRFLPMFSADSEAAFDVARKVGLFVSSNGFLAMTPGGGWEVQDDAGRVLGVGSTIPEAVCRGALAWLGRNGAPSRRNRPE